MHVNESRQAYHSHKFTIRNTTYAVPDVPDLYRQQRASKITWYAYCVPNVYHVVLVDTSINVENTGICNRRLHAISINLTITNFSSNNRHFKVSKINLKKRLATSTQGGRSRSLEVQFGTGYVISACFFLYVIYICAADLLWYTDQFGTCRI